MGETPALNSSSTCLRLRATIEKGIAMNTYSKLLLLGATGLLSAPAVLAQDAVNRAEQQQTVEDFTPKGQYLLSKKEAYAAYRDAVAACRQLRGSERSDCNKNAKNNLQGDLAEAQRTITSGK
jgi:hypothetical protein